MGSAFLKDVHIHQFKVLTYMISLQERKERVLLCPGEGAFTSIYRGKSGRVITGGTRTIHSRLLSGNISESKCTF